MTSIIDALLKLTPHLCSDKALEARVMKDQADSEPAKVMLEHIAETWDRLAKRLRESNGGSDWS
jgi:hypothetical protein